MQLYVRTAQGETYDCPANEAWHQFLSTDGYRITVTTQDGAELVLRRDNEVDPTTNAMDEVAVICNVTIRR